MAEFRRNGDTGLIIIPVSSTSNTLAGLVKVDVRDMGGIPTLFRALNVSTSGVRLKGIKGTPDGARPTAAYLTATKQTLVMPNGPLGLGASGWGWGPGVIEVLGTIITPESPVFWMSAVTFSSPLYGKAADAGWVELQYGNAPVSL